MRNWSMCFQNTWKRIFWLKLHLWKHALLFTIQAYALLSYRFALWGNSPGDQKLFISQKSIIITIAHAISISKWKHLLKNPIFLHFPVYIFINVKTCTYTIHILIRSKDTNLIVTIRLEFVLNFSGILDIN